MRLPSLTPTDQLTEPAQWLPSTPAHTLSLLTLHRVARAPTGSLLRPRTLVWWYPAYSQWGPLSPSMPWPAMLLLCHEDPFTAPLPHSHLLFSEH